ncbi:threonine/serine dehydratase [Azospirillum sp. SYSU D00513]|uniref:threonine ammonia-lyase n=1 Tax=Azospirillum sp. SYSU D00513 TaxID=2812561 RepID=UPI001A95AA0E|nr:threonine/serine dehydratase [Azospirillum sp. SYSU D00513]
MTAGGSADGLAIGFQDIEAAAERLRGWAVETPLIENPHLNERVGGRILIKPENLQRSGAFKFRGAYNRLCQLDEAQRRAGVVAWSSGNHAQGVAAAAKLLGMPAAIVMPQDAPRLKIENTRNYGADVRLYDRWRESREEIAMGIARERGAVTVPPYDDPHIMAGQGTAGLELARQARAIGAPVEQLIVGCSGGGLIAGIATAVKHLEPDARIYSAEPAGFDDLARSLAGGERVSNAPGATSICDALMAPTPGQLTFPIHQALLSGGLTVTDEEVAQAMAYAFLVLKLVVEPGGAVGLAAVLSGKIQTAGHTTAILLTGGNVDPDSFGRIIAGAAAP